MARGVTLPDPRAGKGRQGDRACVNRNRMIRKLVIKRACPLGAEPAFGQVDPDFGEVEQADQVTCRRFPCESKDLRGIALQDAGGVVRVQRRRCAAAGQDVLRALKHP